MNKIDKAKVKVLIKMILLQKSPRKLTAKQIASVINMYDWGIRTPVTSTKISTLLKDELKKNHKNFLSGVTSSKSRGILVYSIPSRSEK